ncbi:putative aldehyde dehydrogenase [Mytilinidion resinicola]|uniref:Aldehyde dehydrogenase n=1 Tax=Mytilinidion resinicola TaxID=574789 RepID=A0A6A6XY91_9PEZI|nr:putative aldehyde dehydrogenase [Mytilinidion resinicola]KAF2801521.1 putative aldehyde dehydrogenase [Mytilinidion resinicola]
MTNSTTVPLIIHGVDVLNGSANEPASLFRPNPDNDSNRGVYAAGATPALCVQAVESCADAFATWRDSQPYERRRLFNNLAKLLRAKEGEIQTLIEQEILCSALWAKINVNDSIALAEEVAATVTSGVLSGLAPIIRDPEAHAVVFKEPFGVVLGIAPWNAPLILGLRAVAAAVAAGNTVLLKGSEISPRTHYSLAKLFQDAGFPPGVVNYIQHSPEDAVSCFEALISHGAVQKCNFTGSTAVGRHVAQRAAFYLKPVVLELGGKNCAIVLEDADLTKAVDQVLLGAFLNSGQICMSTDLVLVAQLVEQQFRRLLHQKLSDGSQQVTEVISQKSRSRIDALVSNAVQKGASTTTAETGTRASSIIIGDVTPHMEFWEQESFGPLLGLRVFDEEEAAIQMVNDSPYGLSGAIFSRNYLKALKLAKRLNMGAVHINSATVHDEACLPHGGRKESGWGRFGAHWGFEEFLQTKTIILHP